MRVGRTNARCLRRKYIAAYDRNNLAFLASSIPFRNSRIPNSNATRKFAQNILKKNRTKKREISLFNRLYFAIRLASGRDPNRKPR